MQSVIAANSWHRWIDESRNYLALWVYAVGSAILAGHVPGMWSDWTRWAYPWRETIATIGFCTLVVVALRSWLGPRARRTPLLRWVIAAGVFSVITVVRVRDRITDQPGWYYERDAFISIVAFGLVGRTIAETVRSLRRGRDVVAHRIEKDAV